MAPVPPCAIDSAVVKPVRLVIVLLAPFLTKLVSTKAVLAALAVLSPAVRVGTPTFPESEGLTKAVVACKMPVDPSQNNSIVPCGMTICATPPVAAMVRENPPVVLFSAMNGCDVIGNVTVLSALSAPV